jgi:RNA polymerase sigma-70 factor (ECF subfamily)
MATSSLAIGGAPYPVSQPPEFQDIYTKYAPSVYRAALRITGNAADAEDVLQNVFLRILSHQLTLDSALSPESYLRRAAANAAIDLIRRRKARHESEAVGEREFAAPDDRLLLKERIRRALAALPPEDAELFVLCYLEGFTYEELARQFQMERGTVASRLFRIRAVLQRKIEK